MTKTLILPAEIMSRELDARLLQGVLALDRGWRIIVGSKALINRAIWRMPRSVYLCQTITHARLPMLKILKDLGCVSYGWDEEGLIYLDRDVYLMRRVSSETLAELRALIAWGRVSAEDVAERADKAGLAVQALGNPRFDILRPELRGMHQDEVSALNGRFGRYILINTNFASQNPITEIDRASPKKMSKLDKADKGLPARFDGLMAHRQRLFEAFLEMVNGLADRLPGHTIVIRPHPAEDASPWQERAAKSPDVHVIREGSSIPWLIAAGAMVHNGCTTAAEAACIGHAPIAYCPELSLEHESGLPNTISHRVATLDELAATVSQAVDGTLEMTPDQRQVLERYVSSLEGPLASEQALDVCDELCDLLGSQRPSILRMVLTRGYGAVRHLYKSLRRNHVTDRYIPKVFPDVSAETISNRANLISKTLKLSFKVEAVQMSRNIFELKRKA